MDDIRVRNTLINRRGASAAKKSSKMACTYVNRTVSGAFGKTGSLIGRHPWYFILFPVGLSVLLAIGFIRINVVIGIEHLYAPISGRTLDDKLFATELFPMNVSTNFDLGRMTRTARFVIVLITPKDGENVLTKEIMEECVRLDDAIRAITVEVEGKNLTYEDVCAKKRENCIKNDPGMLAESIDDILQGRKKIKYPLYVDKATFNFIFYGSILGGVKLDFEDHVVSAKAFRFMYYLDDNDPERNRLSAFWDTKVVEYLESYSGENIDVKWFSRASYSRELKKVSRITSKMLIIIVIIVIVINFLLFMSKRWTQSKPWMSVANILCVLLSLAASVGLCSFCGAEFASVVIFDFFLIMGLGINDTSVLISAWRRTDPSENVDKRMEKTYSEVFVSISMVFLISLIGFLVGLVAPFRAAKIFCTYASVTRVFFFLNEITFLGGCLAVSSYGEKKKLHPLICVTVSSKKSNRDGRCYRFCCTEDGDPGRARDFFITARIWEKYVYFIQKNFVKAAVLLLYAVYLGIAIWQCTKLQVASGITDPFPSNNYITIYYQRHYKYFTAYPHRVQMIINTPLNYSDPEVQAEVEELLQSFENSTYASNAVSSCWLRIYTDIINNPKKPWLFQRYDYTTEDDFLFVLSSVLFKLPMAQDLATDVIFNEDQTKILASRCFFQTRNIKDAQTEKMMLEDFYRIADKSPIPVRFTSMLFRMYELGTMIREVVLWMLPITFGLVLLVFSLFIPNIPCVLFGSLTVISIQVGVLGFSNLWGVKINSFYAVVFIMLVGLASNYLSHLSYAFSTSNEESSRGRMLFALKSRAATIIQNCLILIISPAFLLLITNYVSIVFYKLFFLAVVFSYFHALLLLPVLYALVFGFRGHQNRDSVETCQMDKMSTNPLKT